MAPENSGAIFCYYYLVKHKQDHKKHSLKQVAAYLVSGGAFFWTSYFWFALADKIFRWPLFPAKFSASLVGLFINFLLQHYWVFKTHRSAEPTKHVSGRYLAITVADLLIDYGIVWLLKGYGVTPYIGQFISAGVLTVWNYFWYKYWVFVPKNKRGLFRKVLRAA